MIRSNINILRHKKENSAITLEWVLGIPFMYVTFLLLIIFGFISLAYMNYNNVCNTIGDNLNMRSTGYSNTADTVFPLINTSTVTFDGSISHGSIPLRENQITFNHDNKFIRGATYYALQKMANYQMKTKTVDRLLMPFAQVKSINVFTSQNIDPKMGERLSGTHICVLINWEAYVYDASMDGHPSFPLDLTAAGYNIIT